MKRIRESVVQALRRSADSAYEAERIDLRGPRRPDWLRVMPFGVMHLGCLGVIWVGWSPVALAVALGLYVARMFFVTAFYHRYFSHRAFKTTRLFQAVMALLGLTALQRGPLWWAAHHRHHHQHSDTEEDEHSPAHLGFWWSHMGWFTAERNFPTRYQRVRDFARYPELRFMDRFDTLFYLVFALGVFGLGVALARVVPSWQTNGAQLLVWGFFVSTVAVYHATYTINSLAHRFGKQRFDTGDHSRNNAWLSLLTLGEGWHNNHHHYPVSARQGFYWWEVDISYYGLLLLKRLGLIWALNPVPEKQLTRKRLAPVRTEAGVSPPPRPTELNP